MKELNKDKVNLQLIIKYLDNMYVDKLLVYLYFSTPSSQYSMIDLFIDPHW
jgi:hypothetical protein